MNFPKKTNLQGAQNKEKGRKKQTRGVRSIINPERISASKTKSRVMNKAKIILWISALPGETKQMLLSYLSCLSHVLFCFFSIIVPKPHCGETRGMNGRGEQGPYNFPLQYVNHSHIEKYHQKYKEGQKYESYFIISFFIKEFRLISYI